MEQPEFLSKSMDKMSAKEWESLCDGCGLCCQIRVEDEDSGEYALSNIACRYLCLTSHACKDYAKRQENVEDCIKITPANVRKLNWLPHTCSYRIVARNEQLPGWHHLVSGDPDRVHTDGPSMKGDIISEEDVDWENDADWQ